MLSRFDTDRQTDIIAISISRVSVAVLTRDKNWFLGHIFCYFSSQIKISYISNQRIII